jgi:hypothetical protein
MATPSLLDIHRPVTAAAGILLHLGDLEPGIAAITWYCLSKIERNAGADGSTVLSVDSAGGIAAAAR